MAKFVKFTNASELHNGKIICVNLDHITTVFENETVDPKPLRKKITVLYSVQHDRHWEVKESLEDVMKVMQCQTISTLMK